MSPGTVMAGDSDTFTVTLTNSGTSGSMGSANVTVTGGFTAISATTSTSGWSADPVGNVVELRSTTGSEVGPGSDVIVDITATAPTTTGSNTWDTDAKPTNDFTGSTELTLIGSDPAVTVTPGPLDHFTIASIANQVAGTAFSVDATAYDEWDNVKTDYAGGATLSGDLNNAPDDTAPVYGAFGTWTNGAASASVTAFKAESGRTVTATDGSATGTSNAFTVAPGPVDRFTIASIANQVAGTAFSVDATAYDDWDNVKTDYAGGATVSGDLNNAPDGTAPVYGAFGSWTNGAASASITAFKAESGRTVTATDGSATGTSNSFTIIPGPLEEFKLSDSTNPDDAIDTQTAGTAFTVYATAFDTYGNVKTNYPGGGSQTFSGLQNSPAPSNTPPSYGAITWGASAATVRSITGTFTTVDPETGVLVDTDVAAASDLDGTNPTGTVRNALPSTPEGASTNVFHGDVANGGCVRVQNNQAVVVGRLPANEQFVVSTPSGPRTIEWAAAVVEDNGAAGATPVDRGRAFLLFSDTGNNWCSTTPFATIAALLVALESGDATLGTGQGSASITAFKAGSELTITDDDTGKFGTSILTVLPGPLYRFSWTDQPGASQTAGLAFDSVAVTAYDQWDNVKTNYNPVGAVFSGLSASARGCANDNTTVTPGGTFACNPVYPFTWSSGVGSSSGVKGYKAETNRKLTVTDSTITADSSQFTVGPNEPDFIAFVQQPTLTQVNVVIAPTVTAKVEDAFGNVTPGKPVTVTINPSFNPGGGTLTGGGPINTDASGIAAFPNLSINAVSVGYKLDATVPTTYPPAGSRVATSDAFDIANQVTPCSGSCTASGRTGSVTSTVTANNLGGGAFASRLGPAAIAALGPSRLGVTVADSINIPAGVCATGPTPFTQYGEGFAATSIKSPGNTPSFKVVARLDKSIVRTKPGNPGASKWDICLGAFNATNPPVPPPPDLTAPPCPNPTSSQSWRTKDGTCAKYKDGFFWGLIANYPSKVKDCPTAPGSGLFPGVLSKTKDNAGDVIITFCVPYPWDEKSGWG